MKYQSSLPFLTYNLLILLYLCLTWFKLIISSTNMANVMNNNVFKVSYTHHLDLFHCISLYICAILRNTLDCQHLLCFYI